VVSERLLKAATMSEIDQRRTEQRRRREHLEAQEALRRVEDIRAEVAAVVEHWKRMSEEKKK
jgi:hypothetical protein